MSREERKKFEGLHSPYNKYWIPCVWFTNLAAVARCEGRIKDDHTLKLLLEVQCYTHTHTHLRRPLFGATVVTFSERFWWRWYVKCINTDVKAEVLGNLLGNYWRKSLSFLCEQELNAFRGKCSMLFHYDMISVPLVYTQVSSLLHGCFMVFKLLWILLS